MLSGSRVKVFRPRTDFTHVSESIILAAATQSIKVSVLLESYVEANHDCTCQIDDVTNATLNIDPATTTDQILETVWHQPSQELAHAFRFQLEDAQRVAAIEELEGRRVLQGQVLEIRSRSSRAFDVLQGLLEDRQRPAIVAR